MTTCWLMFLHRRLQTSSTQRRLGGCCCHCQLRLLQKEDKVRGGITRGKEVASQRRDVPFCRSFSDSSISLISSLYVMFMYRNFSLSLSSYLRMIVSEQTNTLSKVSFGCSFSCPCCCQLRLFHPFGVEDLQTTVLCIDLTNRTKGVDDCLQLPYERKEMHSPPVMDGQRYSRATSFPLWTERNDSFFFPLLSTHHLKWSTCTFTGLIHHRLHRTNSYVSPCYFSLLFPRITIHPSSMRLCRLDDAWKGDGRRVY